ADRGVVMGPHQLDQTGAALDIAGSERLQRARHTRGGRIRGEPDIGGTHDLALAHGNAALNLGEVFTDAELDQPPLERAPWTGTHLGLQGATPKTTRAVHKSNAAEAWRGSLPPVWTPVAALLTTWNEIDRLG